MRALLDLGADPTIRDTIHGGTADGWADFGGHASSPRSSGSVPKGPQHRAMHFRERDFQTGRPALECVCTGENPSSWPVHKGRQHHCVGSRESRVRRVLEHTIDIHATPEQVWEALTGFEAYDGLEPVHAPRRRSTRGRKRLRIELSSARRAPHRRLALGGRRRPGARAALAGRASAGALHRRARVRDHACRVGRTGRPPRLVPRPAGPALRPRDRPDGPRVRAHARRAQGAGRGALAAGHRGAADAERHGARHPRLRGARLDAPHGGRPRRRVGARGRARRRARPRPRRRDARPSRRRRLAAGRRRPRSGHGRRRHACRLRTRARRAPGHPRRGDRPAPTDAGRGRDGRRSSEAWPFGS